MTSLRSFVRPLWWHASKEILNVIGTSIAPLLPLCFSIYLVCLSHGIVHLGLLFFFGFFEGRILVGVYKVVLREKSRRKKFGATLLAACVVTSVGETPTESAS